MNLVIIDYENNILTKIQIKIILRTYNKKILKMNQ